MTKVLHHWRWRSPSYLITCGTKTGLIDPTNDGPNKRNVTCKRCLKILKIRGW